MAVFTVHFLDFPGSVPDFEAASSGGVLLDVMPSFSEEVIYQRLADYGEEGRRNYTFRNLTVDFVLPLSVLPFLFLFMLKAVDRLTAGSVAQTYLLFLPFVYVIFDFAENGAVLVLLANFPDRLSLVAGALPYLTLIKRAASMLAIVVPISILSFLRIRLWLQRGRPIK